MNLPCNPTSLRPADELAPSEEAVRAELDRIVGSADFAQSERMKSFLRYVVEETLAGQADRLKEYAIATEAFGRDETFDSQTNTIVRVEAGRLRRRLERYYLIAGREDEIRIDLPKGAYVPQFRTMRPATKAQPDAAEAHRAQGDTASELPTGPSIAVLPFENLSGDPEQAFFADGITEEIINDLTHFPDLRVISRHSTFKYKGQTVDIRDVGRDLGVRYVLEGSVRKGGQMVRVTGQLVDAADGAHLFSETYDRDLSVEDILAIQDDISDRIVAAVGQPYGVMARSGARRSRSNESQHMDAYDAVLRFYEYWFSYAPELYEQVRDGLERAVELEPDYSSAWAALAAMYVDEVRFCLNPRRKGDQLDRAMDAARRSVVLDPESSMAYHILFSTHFHRGELDEFKATGERALGLNPNHADMLADYGLMLCCIEEWNRGLALAEKAIALSPTHPGWFHAAAVYDHYRNGAYENALAEASQIQMPGFYPTYVKLAMCCGQLGRHQEGAAALDKLLELAQDFPEHAWDYLAVWNLPEDLAGHMVDGLRKAGLRIPDRSTSAAE